MDKWLFSSYHEEIATKRPRGPFMISLTETFRRKIPKAVWGLSQKCRHTSGLVAKLLQPQAYEIQNTRLLNFWTISRLPCHTRFGRSGPHQTSDEPLTKQQKQSRLSDPSTEIVSSKCLRPRKACIEKTDGRTGLLDSYYL